MDEYRRGSMLPEVEDCSNGYVPMGTYKIRIADDVVSMPKYFFDNYRKKLYEHLNACLRDGRLRAAAGFSFHNASIGPGLCDFTGWDFWRVNRKSFLMDIHFTLQLSTETGRRPWKGVLELECGFQGSRFSFSLAGLVGAEKMPDRSGWIRLSPFLVPYLSGPEIDGECEKIWKAFQPEALPDPKQRKAEELAAKKGLTVRYLPVYRDQGVAGILFFTEGKLRIKEDQDPFLHAPEMEEALEREEQENPPRTVVLPADTIVINTNQTRPEYAAFGIYHEIIHYEYHYLFFRLQQLGNNDIREMKTREVTVNQGDKISDPVYWMEKQANRGAYGLLLPITWMRQQTAHECAAVREYRHQGELFEKAGRKLCAKYGIPNYRMRARLIQMGYIAAKGSLNWLRSGVRLEAFAFDPDSCRRIEETFIIDKFQAGRLYETDEKYRDLFNTGRFIYADGHIVRRDSRFVEERNGRLLLTPWANEHVDRCCLRFQRVYIQSGVGQFLFGRMNYDEDYVAKTMFYLGDCGNRELINEMQAEQTFINAFPADFWEGVKLLMARARITNEKMAEQLHVEERTLYRWMKQPDKRLTEDLVMMISLILELPDWISSLLFDRAGLALSSSIPRHLALQWIRRAMWKDGVDKANEYLKTRKFAPLMV